MLTAERAVALARGACVYVNQATATGADGFSVELDDELEAGRGAASAARVARDRRRPAP